MHKLLKMCVLFWTQNAGKSDETPANGSNQNQNTEELHEMNPLLKTEDQDTGRTDVTEENQPNSVESPT